MTDNEYFNQVINELKETQKDIARTLRALETTHFENKFLMEQAMKIAERQEERQEETNERIHKRIDEVETGVYMLCKAGCPITLDKRVAVIEEDKKKLINWLLASVGTLITSLVGSAYLFFNGNVK